MFDFSPTGPMLGPVALVKRTQQGFEPKRSAELEREFAAICNEVFECAELEQSLHLVCRALNDGDLGKAAIATQFLRLPSLVPPGTALDKASVDDPKHPGWPRGAPDGEGGQYRPTTNESYQTESKRKVRPTACRTFRSILKRVLTTKRLLRLGLEEAGEAIPIVDVLITPITVADDVQLLKDIAEEVAGSETALNFAEVGPRNLQDLLISKDKASFTSYNELIKTTSGPLTQEDLEKHFGPAGEDLQYHHIVEQGPNAAAFPQELLQSTDNIAVLPSTVHEAVSALYSTKMEFKDVGEMTLRQFLRGRSFEQQRAWGLWALREVGALK